MKRARAENCKRCKVGESVASVHVFTRQLDACSFRGEVAASKCDYCGEELIPASAARAFDDALTTHLARSGAIGPQAFRWLRARADLESKQLATLLDVSPGTVSRWENGRKPLERRAMALVAALALEAHGEPPNTRGLLDQLARDRKPARRVRLDLSRLKRD